MVLKKMTKIEKVKKQKNCYQSEAKVKDSRFFVFLFFY